MWVPRRATIWRFSSTASVSRVALSLVAEEVLRWTLLPANPIRRIFGGLYQFERTTEPIEGEAPYFVTRSRTRGTVAPLFERYLYQPAVRSLEYAAGRLAPWIPPTVNRGLMLFAITVAILLVWAAS